MATNKTTTTKQTKAEVQQGNPLDIALDKARNMMSHIGKESKNDHFKFDYTSGENMLVACRKVLHECGILVILEQVQHIEVAGRLLQQCAFLVKHIESGDMMPNNFTCPVVGHADDKASFGTNTGIWKYYLRGLLMLPMGDYDEQCDEPCERDETPAEKIAKSVIDIGIIPTVQNLYEEMDSEWVEKVQKHFENINPEAMTNEQLETIIERAKIECMKI